MGNSTSSNLIELALTAPVTGTVTEIVASLGAQVSKGEVLMKIEPKNIEIRVKRLESVLRLLALEKDQDAERLWKLKHRFLEISEDLSAKNLKFAQGRVESAERSAEVGAVSIAHLEVARASLQRALAEKDRAQNNLILFETEQARQRQQLEIAYSQIEAERLELEMLRNGGSIISPYSGFFVSLVGVGSHVMEGGEICQLTVTI